MSSKCKTIKMSRFHFWVGSDQRRRSVVEIKLEQLIWATPAARELRNCFPFWRTSCIPHFSVLVFRPTSLSVYVPFSLSFFPLCPSCFCNLAPVLLSSSDRSDEMLSVFYPPSPRASASAMPRGGQCRPAEDKRREWKPSSLGSLACAAAAAAAVSYLRKTAMLHQSAFLFPLWSPPSSFFHGNNLSLWLFTLLCSFPLFPPFNVPLIHILTPVWPLGLSRGFTSVQG